MLKLIVVNTDHAAFSYKLVVPTQLTRRAQMARIMAWNS